MAAPAPTTALARQELAQAPDPDGFYPDPSVPDAPGWWVTCDDHAVKVADQAAGDRLIDWLAAATFVGACKLAHRVEYVIIPEEEVA